MAFQDFTTWDDQDENGHTVVTTNKIACDATTQWRAAWYALSKDFGVGGLSANRIDRFEVTIGVATDSPLSALWSMCGQAIITDLYTQIQGGENIAALYYYGGAGGPTFTLRVWESGGPPSVLIDSDTSVALTPGTKYYITAEWDITGGANSVGQFKATIRTGNHGGPTFDTLTVDADNYYTYQFLTAINSYDTASDPANYATIDLENWSFVPVPTPGRRTFTTEIPYRRNR